MFNIQEVKKQILQSSDYLRLLLENNPDLWKEIYTFLSQSDEKVPQEYTNDYYYKKHSFPKVDEDPEKMFLNIRKIKNKELAIIAFKDFLFNNSVSMTLIFLSRLADFCIDWSIRSVLNIMHEKNYIGYDKLKNNIMIIGMGKLGGNELNISSDIDLIFLGKDEIIQDDAFRKELETFLTHFLDFLNRTSQEGFLYRVDMRLRPEGEIGPLIMGFQNALEYYKERGRQWELQAMIKKRLLWGNDLLYQEFVSSMDKLIYQHHQPQKILFDIWNIKNEIEKQFLNKNTEFNIKLSPGGIRDIEFIIQFLQLIHGIRYPEIRNANSLSTLNSLKTFNIITPDEFNTLNSSYIILRKIENILQLINNTSVHSLPGKKGIIEKVFKPWKIEGFDFPNEDYEIEFKNKVNTIMSNVRTIFTALFDETIRYIKLKDNLLSQYQDIPGELLEDHFLRMDSEYFLRFQEMDIYKHIKMIEKLNLNNLVELEINKNKEEIWSLTIVAFDYYYEFSKIAGLISANFLKILSGESYTYGEYSSQKDEKEEPFYRRKKKQIYFFSSEKKAPSLIYRRKIVCYLKVQMLETIQKNATHFDNILPDWDQFKKELNYILHCLETNQTRKSEEFLNNKILSLISKLPITDIKPLSPVEIEVDNESSRQYTILNIYSKDSFAFLYTFTNVLALRNYYIYKIEIDTQDDKAFDRLFILTRDGKKIIEANNIENLKIAVAFIKQYSSLLQNAVNPDNALRYFDELLSRILESSEKKELPILGQQDVQEKLATIFGISDYFWEDFIRVQYTDMLPILNDPSIEYSFSKKELIDRYNHIHLLNEPMQTVNLDDFNIRINEFKDREMFRIDLRQILKKIEMIQFSIELTELAEAVIELAVKKIEIELLKKYSFRQIPPWAVFGLGKLGGRELGYASDIEVMLVYDNPGQLKDAIEIDSYFEKMMQMLIHTIHSKREGIFEIDLNLRPYGKSGNLAVSKANFKEYFSLKGRAYYFEKQALVKLRPIVSNESGYYLFQEIVNYRDLFVFSGEKPDIEALLNLREKQIQTYIKNSQDINIKYSRGCLVDIEYLVQSFQIVYGKIYPGLKNPSTVDAIDSLYECKIIDDFEQKTLKESYLFYRNLINILRMVKGNAKDLTIYPENTIEYDYLVKRSFFVGIIEKEVKELLADKIREFRKSIISILDIEMSKLK